MGDEAMSETSEGSMSGSQRIRRLIEGAAVDRLPFMPITMMFAADFIGVSYRQYATEFRTLAEGQMRVAESFELDYVSCISDPAREAADCGAAVEYYDDHPPALNERYARLADKTELLRLKAPDPLGGGRMHDRVRAAALLKERIAGERLVEGWVEGPCAEAADLRGINAVMMDFYEDPGFVHDLYGFVTALGLSFAKAQIEAGAELIGVGDAAASLVGPQIYEEFVWPCEKELVDGIHALGGMVRLHICGNTSAILRGMGTLGCEIVDLDHMVSMEAARQAMGPEPVLLGNIDPVSVLRNGRPAGITAALAQCFADTGGRYIVGAGCEVVRDTPHENLRAMQRFAAGHH
jgi:MtaA/CmuA family methyltransferase